MTIIDVDELKKKKRKYINYYNRTKIEDAVSMHDINFAPIISPETLRPTATLEKDSDYDRNHVYRVLKCSKCGTLVYSEEWFGKGSVPCYTRYCKYCGAKFVK